jgi:outer membrane protein assembly factor BamB
MASPVVCGDTALWVNRTGAVFSYDAATGEKLFTARIKQSCWATPVGVGDRIYFFGKDGVTSVLKSGRTFEILAENLLWDPETVEKDTRAIEAETDPNRKTSAAMHAAPEVYGVAIVNGRIVLRTGAKVFCLSR